MNNSTKYTHHLSVSAAENVTAWLNEPKYSEYRAELQAMIKAAKWQELEDSFFTKIAFGTGGMRGRTGLGSNRINRITIGQAAQALCLYALHQDVEAPNKGIAIACDTRVTSPELSRLAAEVCAANGFKAYVYESFRSTPQLSFTVRELQCAAGIVISASHNPPQDNGFKAYWSDGAQPIAPHDKALMDIATQVEEIKSLPYDEAVRQDKIIVLDKDIDEKYAAAVAAEANGKARNIRIVYSPLHGAGQTNVLPVLQKAGFTDISLVHEQMTPDGTFPTVPGGKSNPEESGANKMAIEQMLAEEADIALTNDPDADRIGVMVRQGDQAFSLTGNQSLALAADYVFSSRATAGTLKQSDCAITTIVTTDLVKAIVQSYGCETYSELPVGIKFIADMMNRQQAQGNQCLISGEESYGITLGNYIRDKDGAAGALVMAELAAQLKADNRTLLDKLYELFGQHGVFAERLDSVYCEGAEGFEVMQAAMARLRNHPPKKIGSHTVTAVRDHATAEELNLADAKRTRLACRKTDVVALIFNDDPRCRVTVRPSGTEPKIKFYVQWYEPAKDTTSPAIKQQYDAIHEQLKSVSKQLEKIVLSE